MSSSSRRGTLALLLLVTASVRAQAQQQAQGFAVERLYPSAPAAGWFVMDALDMGGGLGGAFSLTFGYAHNPLRVGDGPQRLAVVSDQAFADVGASVTYDRWRAYLNFNAPLVIQGQSGAVAGYTFTAPAVDIEANPDTLTDARIGADVRVLGGPADRFRLGLGAQLFIPNGSRSDYDTDHTYRAMGRLLFAGDERLFTYAGQLGIHIRPLDDSATPGSPRGNELIFGAAGGPKLVLGQNRGWAAVIGPELFGATAFHSFLSSNTTALEGLLSGRLEGTADDRSKVRVKLGAGIGLNPQFGAPQWRVVLGIEVFAHGEGEAQAVGSERH